jgi:hypothetical protein
MGDPYRLGRGETTPSTEELEGNTRVTLPDEDAGPTKAWLVTARKQDAWKDHFEWVYGQRPRLELYDLKRDPHESTNVANDPEYAAVLTKMEAELMAELEATHDPRLVNDGEFYETSPMSDPAPTKLPRNRGKGKSGQK